MVKSSPRLTRERIIGMRKGTYQRAAERETAEEFRGLKFGEVGKKVETIRKLPRGVKERVVSAGEVKAAQQERISKIQEKIKEEQKRLEKYEKQKEKWHSRKGESAQAREDHLKERIAEQEEEIRGYKEGMKELDKGKIIKYQDIRKYARERGNIAGQKERNRQARLEAKRKAEKIRESKLEGAGIKDVYTKDGLLFVETKTGPIQWEALPKERREEIQRSDVDLPRTGEMGTIPAQKYVGEKPILGDTPAGYIEELPKGKLGTTTRISYKQEEPTPVKPEFKLTKVEAAEGPKGFFQEKIVWPFREKFEGAVSDIDPKRKVREAGEYAKYQFGQVMGGEDIISRTVKEGPKPLFGVGGSLIGIGRLPGLQDLPSEESIMTKFSEYETERAERVAEKDFTAEGKMLEDIRGRTVKTLTGGVVGLYGEARDKPLKYGLLLGSGYVIGKGISGALTGARTTGALVGGVRGAQIAGGIAKAGVTTAGVGLTAAYTADVVKDIQSASSYEEKGRVAFVSGAELTALGVGIRGGYGTKTGKLGKVEKGALRAREKFIARRLKIPVGDAKYGYLGKPPVTDKQLIKSLRKFKRTTKWDVLRDIPETTKFRRAEAVDIGLKKLRARKYRSEMAKRKPFDYLTKIQQEWVKGQAEVRLKQKMLKTPEVRDIFLKKMKARKYGLKTLKKKTPFDYLTKTKQEWFKGQAERIMKYEPKKFIPRQNQILLQKYKLQKPEQVIKIKGVTETPKVRLLALEKLKAGKVTKQISIQKATDFKPKIYAIPKPDIKQEPIFKTRTKQIQKYKLKTPRLKQQAVTARQRFYEPQRTITELSMPRAKSLSIFAIPKLKEKQMPTYKQVIKQSSRQATRQTQKLGQATRTKLIPAQKFGMATLQIFRPAQRYKTETRLIQEEKLREPPAIPPIPGFGGKLRKKKKRKDIFKEPLIYPVGFTARTLGIEREISGKELSKMAMSPSRAFGVRAIPRYKKPRKIKTQKLKGGFEL